jgi:hypothetical protein
VSKKKKIIEKTIKNKKTTFFKGRKKITLALPHRTSVPMKAMLLLVVRSPLVAAG